jgi:hypothetical protein
MGTDLLPTRHRRFERTGEMTHSCSVTPQKIRLDIEDHNNEVLLCPLGSITNSLGAS